MPHLRIDYTANLDAHLAMGELCQALAAAMAALTDDFGKPVFPLAGTRVLAYPAPFHSVANGDQASAFVYLNLRVTPGRSAALLKLSGDALLAVVRDQLDWAATGLTVGITLHIDEVTPSYEGRHRPA